MNALLVAALLLPLLLAVALAARPLRPAALALAAWAPLPALGLAIAAPDGLQMEIAWLILGTRLGIDPTGRIFLFATALVWLIAGWYAHVWLRGDARRVRFAAFFLLTQAGNLAVCVTQDAASFYFAFALMTFAAYGLIVHAGGDEARRAGRIYIVMAVMGEALLVAGILLAVSTLGSHRLGEMAAALAWAPDRTPIAALLFAGFGIKVGVPLLHMWLPLAHPVAPVPASAVLSGVMVKAGVLGWLRFLPLGAGALPELGAVILAAGLAAMFLGVAFGLAQRDAKVLLAYSTISQMGFLTAGVGAGLLAPAQWPALLAAVTLYVLHHALAKSALFLGIGLAKTAGGTPLVLAGLALPALALAGAPWSGGAWAKAALKTATHELPGAWPALLAWALPLAALATALLMARLLVLAAREPAHGRVPGLGPAWSASLAAVAALSWWMGWSAHAQWHWLDATWPLLAAALVTAATLRLGLRMPQLPPGDLVVPAEHVATALTRRRPGEIRAPSLPQPSPATWLRLEARLGAWRMATGLWLAAMAALAVALAL